jgi:hypothetical protein
MITGNSVRETVVVEEVEDKEKMKEYEAKLRQEKEDIKAKAE